MAEAFATIGIAANIIQLTQFGVTLITEARECYESASGAKDENIELEEVIRHIENLNESITAASQTSQAGSLSSDENALLKLAKASRPLCNQLLEILGDLKVPDTARFRKLASLRQAIRSVMKKKSIEGLEMRLRKIQDEATKRMVYILRNDYVSLHSAIRHFSEASQRDTTNRLDQLRLDILQTAKIHGSALKDLSTRVSALAEDARKLEWEQKILQSLCFESINQRHSDIEEAHKETLRWIFDKSKTQLLDWLESDDGIYWIGGRAGSGKSIVMKYICEHERTLRALHTWARPEKLVTANYFFWNAGLPMQKSQKGLLQSLLYQVLRSCPDLIHKVCTDHQVLEPWSSTELSDVLEQIAHQTSLSAKFCFFIDGLDEYDGYETEIIGILQKLVDSQSIKLCVSSRPWTAFVLAFSKSDRKLLVEDLTMNDMRKYTQDMLSDNELFRNLRNADPRCNSLVPQIAEKAHGVWLWVYLVVRDLLRDLNSDEGYPHLQRRLDGFPPELEEYFRATLKRIDPIYRKETAQIFLIAVEAARPVPVYALMFLDSERQDSEYALKADLRPVDETTGHDICMTWKNRLNNRCKDLLEVRFHRDGDTSGVEFLRHKVDFLHRTVRDFLRDNYQTELREQTGAEYSALLSLCGMVLALVKIVPVQDFRSASTLNFLFEYVDEFMYYVRKFDRYHRALLRTGQRASLSYSTPRYKDPYPHGDLRNSPLPNTDPQIELCNALLDELDHVYSAYAQDERNHWTNARDSPADTNEPFHEYGQNTFLGLAIQAKLQIYVSAKLNTNPKLLRDKKGRPLLDYALRPTRVTPANLTYQIEREGTSVDVEMVSLLLGKGADPNQIVDIYNECSVWHIFLASCRENANQAPPPLKNAWYKAVELLIENGADPKIRLEVGAVTVPKRARFPLNGYYSCRIEPSELQPLTVPEVLRGIFTPEKSTRLEEIIAEVLAQKQWVVWKLIGWT